MNLIIGLSLLISLNAWSQNEEQTVTSSTVQTSDVKVQEEQKNDEITNARLAASAGSDKKLSMMASLGYNGGSLTAPLSAERPNYRGLPSAPLTKTTLGGNISAGLRLTPEDQLRLGVGVSMRTPLHNNLGELGSGKSANGTPLYNVSTPTLSWNRTKRLGSVIISTDLGADIATDDQDVNFNGSLGWLWASVDMVFTFENSSWQPGFSTVLSQSFYNDNGTFNSSGDRRGNVGLGIYPFVEYQINDTYALRSLFGFFNYTNYRDQNVGQFTQDGNYISMGLGISPSRKIWIYPNLQFNPNVLQADFTNVAISTVFSF